MPPTAPKARQRCAWHLRCDLSPTSSPRECRRKVAAPARVHADKLYQKQRKRASGAPAKVDILTPSIPQPHPHRLHSLLPTDFGRFAQPIEKLPPLTTPAPQLLLERLGGEYVYAQLCEAAMHAFEAEDHTLHDGHGIDKNQHQDKAHRAFTPRASAAPQEQISTEIVHLAASAEAFTHLIYLSSTARIWKPGGKTPLSVSARLDFEKECGRRRPGLGENKRCGSVVAAYAARRTV